LTTRYTYTMGTREQRKNRRAVRSALKVTIGKQTYQAINWSLGGLLIEDAESKSGLNRTTSCAAA
jgi:hypothetical protein